MGRSHEFGFTIMLTIPALLAALAAIILSHPNPPKPDTVSSPTPAYYLWAWRRTEDLSFVNSSAIAGTVKGAIWTGTVRWEDGRMTVIPRLNPVTYPSGMEIVAVTRLEIAGIPTLSTAAEMAEILVQTGSPFNPAEYQIDFDARLSQRVFYRQLLRALRGRIGDTALSIAALASWCFHDAWIDTLPIDAAVPMIYRMGPDTDYIRTTLFAKRKFPAPICHGNIGYSADEPLAPIDRLERVFLFHPQPWTQERLAHFQGRIRGLQ